ncbi:hypothetical protein HYT24_02670 [Candidatus Pacearchaeota archaeon]|nr:hypothetical protein [Candidatus Pacearchaeota archaeon]
MDFEEIEETASHEVSHLHHKDHSPAFHDTHEETKTSLWKPPSGTTGLYKTNIKPKSKRVNKNHCSYNPCNNKKESKCRYCEKEFCSEHIRPKPTGMPRFHSTDIESQLLMEEYRRKDGHPCAEYVGHWKKQLKKEGDDYKDALDRLLSKKKERIVFPKVSEFKKQKHKTAHELISDDIQRNAQHILENDSYKYKGNVKIPKNNKTKNHSNKLLWTFILVLLLGVFYLWQDGYIQSYFDKDDFESKNMSDYVFNQINIARENNFTNSLLFNPNAYEIAINLSEKFYNSNIYFIDVKDLKVISEQYELTNVKYISKKLDSLSQEEFSSMAYEWTSRDIFTQKTLNRNFKSGAVGCYKEACVLVLNLH